MGLGFFIRKNLETNSQCDVHTYQKIKKEIQKYKSIQVYKNNEPIIKKFIMKYVIDVYDDKPFFKCCLNAIQDKYLWEHILCDLGIKHITIKENAIGCNDDPWYIFEIIEKRPNVFMRCLDWAKCINSYSLIFHNDAFKTLVKDQWRHLTQNKTLALTDKDIHILCEYYKSLPIYDSKIGTSENNDTIILYYVLFIDVFDINKFKQLFSTSCIFFSGVLNLYRFMFNKNNTLLYNMYLDRLKDIDRLVHETIKCLNIDTMTIQEKQQVDRIQCIHEIINTTTSSTIQANKDTWDYIRQNIYTGFHYRYDDDEQCILCYINE